MKIEGFLSKWIMKNFLVFSLLAGFLPVNSVAHYFFVDERHNFADARARCQELNYTDLAVVDTQEKADLATKVIQRGYDGVWIGLTYETTSREFLWADSSSLGWSNWYNKGSVPEPNYMEIFPSERCVRINPSWKYQWGTRGCTTTKYALCEKTDACDDSAFFVVHAENLDSSDQSLTSVNDSGSKLECSLLCVGQCCYYFLYDVDNTTCVLFANTYTLMYSGINHSSTWCCHLSENNEDMIVWY